MRTLILTAAVLLAGVHAAPAQPVTVITGATLIDVSAHGASRQDVKNGVVVMQGGRIIAAGPVATTQIPPAATRIDRRGRFIVPGLVDGFAGLQSQAEADAMLYEGVTTVVASQDDRRGHLFQQANPAPHIYQPVIRPNPDWLGKAQESKSLFASFSSEKEDSCSFLKKRTKRLLFSGVGFEYPGPGRRMVLG